MKAAKRASVVASVAALASCAVAAFGACSAFTGSDSQGAGNTDASELDGAAASEGGAAVMCTPKVVPPTALPEVTLTFNVFSTGAPVDGWKSIGYDRDNLCTTATSTDVCKRMSNSPVSDQADGVDGIDNAWGAHVTSILKGLLDVDPMGYLTTDASGTGTLFLTITPTATLEVPIVLARVQQSDSTATLSAIVPMDAFITAFLKFAGRYDKMFCSGATIGSIEGQLRMTADVLVDGTQSATATCNAISLGATLTGVTPGMPSVPADAGPGPCP